MDYSTNRSDAKKAGAKYYFTGKPCARGHVALRKTKGACVQCIKEDWAKDNERRKTLPKSEAAREAGKRYYERNREAVIARSNARPIEEKRQNKDKHRRNNPEYYKSLVSLRKRRHRNATPPWLTTEQKLVIRNLYLSAMTLTKATGERYVVDHIVPLSNPDVCGLHVPWNLRVITQEENLKKSNKHTP
jgi:5-methylcytosine-specific restriction endonuclease McrA